MMAGVTPATPSARTIGPAWLSRSNFLHLQEQDIHKITATTPLARRTIEKEWQYPTDPHLPPRMALDSRGTASVLHRLSILR
jgi:hypothetical protein